MYVAIKSVMSETKDEGKDIESAQKNQKKIGSAENDPETKVQRKICEKKQPKW
jgi:hypothetical protein